MASARAHPQFSGTFSSSHGRYIEVIPASEPWSLQLPRLRMLSLPEHPTSSLSLLIPASFHPGKLSLLPHHPPYHVCVVHSHRPGMSSPQHLLQLLLTVRRTVCHPRYTVSSMRAELRLYFSLLWPQHLTRAWHTAGTQ